MLALELVRVNGEICQDKSRRLKEGEMLFVSSLPEQGPEFVPGNAVVIFADNDMAVFDKDPGVISHPTSYRDSRPSLAGRAVELFPQVIGVGEDDLRPGIVHRLDKGTSGLIVVALNQESYVKLRKAFNQHLPQRTYLAIAEGSFDSREGTIEADLGRDDSDRSRIGVVSGGRKSTTDYRLLAQTSEMALLELTPRTGRTHQIRVHLAAIGHPIAGDRDYGSRLSASRPYLHSARLSLRHPSSGEILSLASGVPDDMVQFLNQQGAFELCERLLDYCSLNAC
jgi:23S rRNA pseudouridine1911/1915/1917 synthase